MSSQRLVPSTRVPLLSLIVAEIVALAGFVGPWVPHRAAGLVITGLDLGEYVKFLPEVAAGQIAVTREVFYLPLLAASVCASLLSNRRVLPAWLRGGLAIGAVPLALAMLPPAWSPALLLQPEFRLQLIAITGCLALLPFALIMRFLPDWLALTVVALLATAAAAMPSWSFLQVRPAIEALYRHDLPLGWGFWTTLFGNLAAAIVAIGIILGRSSRSRP